MKKEEIIRALRRLQVQTGSLACLGCGYEHNCGVHGCAVLRAACAALSNTGKPENEFVPCRTLENQPHSCGAFHVVSNMVRRARHVQK